MSESEKEPPLRGGDRSGGEAGDGRRVGSGTGLDELIAALETGRFDEARRLASARVADDDKDVEAWKILAVLDAQAGRYEDALKNNDAALAVDSSDAGAWLNQGNLLRLLRRPDESRECYRRVLEQDPDHTDAAFTLAALREEDGEFEAAVAEYRRVLDLDPDHGPARFNLARRLAESGEADEAMEQYQWLTERKSLWPDPWRNRANLLRRHGKIDEAIACFEALSRLEPDDAVSQHMLSALRGETPTTSSRAYVQRVFDEYAPSFDASMEAMLDYRGARGLAEELQASGLPQDGVALDLGCGTGLLAAELVDASLDWVGVDLSVEMVKRAREKGLYSRLEVADVHEFLEETDDRYVLCTATDVFIYIGDVSPLFGAVRDHLVPGGVFAFCTERWGGDAEATDDGDPDASKKGFRLEPSGRFSHRDEYVQRLLDETGFRVERWSHGPLRREAGTTLEGSFVVARLG